MCTDTNSLNIDFCNTYNTDELIEALILGIGISKFFHSRKHILFEVKMSFIELNNKELTSFIKRVTEFCEFKKIAIPSVILNISKYNESVQYAVAYTIVMGLSTWRNAEQSKN